MTGKYKDIASIPPNRRRTIQYDAAKNPLCRHGGPGGEAEVLGVLAALKVLSDESGISAGTLALGWCVRKPGVATTIVGCRDRAQLWENLPAAETDWDDNRLASLDETSRPLKERLGNEPDLWELGEKSRVW